MQIKLENISVRYITGDFTSIGLKDYVIQKIRGTYKVNEFMAVNNVSFELEKGDLLGIVGSNGAGKSTLLKVISGIMCPSTGKIAVNGSIASLLELASGFDEDLTVTENTFLRGAMLGYTREFMNNMYKQIIEFAELEEFQDRPFKQLSSGMKSRLGFAICTAVNPDILILDEPTSSLNETDSRALLDLMLEFKKQGLTMIIITHKLNEVVYVSDKITVIRDGSTVETLVNDGNVDEARIIKGMVGREITDRFPKRHDVAIGDVNLEVKDWSVDHPIYEGRKVVDNVNFNVKKGETTTVNLVMRPSNAGKQEIGKLDAALTFNPLVLADKAITKQADGQQALKQAKEGFYIAVVLGVNEEPTNHVLRDIAALKGDFEQWGQPIYMFFPGEEQLAKFRLQDFPGLPSTIQYGLDKDVVLQKAMAEGGQLGDPDQLPIVVLANTDGRVFFASQGYTIGMGEQLMKVVHNLNK